MTAERAKQVELWIASIGGAVAIVSALMFSAVKVLGLDTVEARQQADTAIVEEVLELKMMTWCILWDVDPALCVRSYETTNIR